MSTSTHSQYFRYPGTNPFEASEANIFFGREDTINALSDYIQLNQTTVLYSKSGLGKSSLINAGLKPFLDKNGYLKPIYIRFKAYSGNENKEKSPTYTTRKNIVGGPFKKTFLDVIIKNESSFWHDVKEQQIIEGEQQEYILIFDQFEELFTYPEDQIQVFKENLAELLYSKVPQRYRDIIKTKQAEGAFTLTDEQLEVIYTKNSIKALFAIRSDKMHLLNSLSENIPTILTNCFELTPLNRSHAQDAIYNPALSRNPHFESPRFEYTSEAVNKIILFLSKNGTKSIESVYLQIICNAIEKKVIAENIEIINVSHIGNLEDLVENYYVDQLATISNEKDRKKAQLLIEDGLIFEPEQRRLSLFQGQIEKKFGVSSHLLEQLINSRLIRSESLSDGGYIYELSHDSLVAPILKIKQNRQGLDEKEKLKQQAEAAFLREKKAKTKIAKTKRTNIGLVALSLLACSFLVFSLFQTKKIKTVNSQLAVFIQEKVIGKTKNLNYEGIFNDLVSIKNSIREDSFYVNTLLEIAYVYNESNQVDSAKKVLKLLENGGDKIQPEQSKTVQSSIIAYQKLYKIADTRLADRYMPKLSEAIPISDIDVSFSLTELTVWQYNIYCLANKLDIKKTGPNWGLQGNYPVVKVDWYDAISYANWLSNKMNLDTAYHITKPQRAHTNIQDDDSKNEWIVVCDTTANGFRLPSFKEWSMAGGYGQHKLPGIPFIAGVSKVVSTDADGNELTEEEKIKESVSPYMWFLENSRVDGILEPRPVAQCKPNKLGLYDMSGNVWEWCEDDDGYHEGTKLKVTAGGAFNYSAHGCTLEKGEDDNNYVFSKNRENYNTLGIRLCRTIK